MEVFQFVQTLILGEILVVHHLMNVVSLLTNHYKSRLLLMIRMVEQIQIFLRHYFPKMNSNELFVSVPPFEPSTVDIVYHDWLTMKQRSLTDEQRIFLREFMSERTEILPLYMKLIFDIISNWHSYDPIDIELKELKNIDQCIKYLFNHLRKIHNPILFARSMCYMTACRNGISQNELEDVLSLDDDVLKSVFEHFIPPIRRLPGILWTRIRNDLDEYITEKEADDSTVIYWY